MRKVLREFTAKHGGVILPFAMLPKTHQLAIVWYMAVNGEAWEILFDFDRKDDCHNTKNKKILEKVLPEYVKKYGKIKFGVITLSTALCKRMLMQEREVKQDWKNFDAYHKWYQDCSGNPTHKRKNPWPCILGSDFKNEFIEDGWHRFHRYVQLKMLSIPCVYYP